MSRPMMKLSIVIINYRSLELTRACLDSIREHGPGVPFEVIVVDNDSQDGSYEGLCASHGSWARIVESGENGGFSKGNNVGAALATGEYLLFFNADTLLKPAVLGEMIGFMDDHPEYGAITCQSVNGAGEYLNNGHAFPSWKSIAAEVLIRPLVPAGAKARLRRSHASESLGLMIDKDWISGSALLMPADLFREIGGWDEAYFMYMEDVTLCQEVARAGRKRGIYNKLGFVHYHGDGSGSARVIFEASRSEVLYARKYLPGQVGVIKRLTIERARQRCRALSSEERRSVISRLEAL